MMTRTASILALLASIILSASPPPLSYRLWLPIVGNERMTAYYVATVANGGNDGNPGTVLEPWATFAYADTQISPGDTVHIRGGSYAQRILPTQSGTSGNLITYTNYLTETVTIQGEMGENEIINLNSRSYTAIDGLAISHIDTITSVKFGWVTMMYSGSHHNLINDCTLIRAGDPETLYNADYWERGIIVSEDADYNRVLDTYIRGHNIGIYIGLEAQYTEILDSIVRYTGISCINIATSHSLIQGTLIQGNIIEYSWSEDGIQFTEDPEAGDPSTDVSNQGTIILDNIIRYHGENAIDTKGAKYVVIDGNLIYGTIGSSDGGLGGYDRGSLDTILRGTGTTSKDVIIRNNVLYDNSDGIRMYDGYLLYNNTLVSNNRDYTGPDSHEPGHVWQACNHQTGDVVFLNNICVGHWTSEVGLHTSDLRVNHNLYYNSDGELFEDRTADEILNWADWLTRLAGAGGVTGKDANSVSGSDPRFYRSPEHPQCTVLERGKRDFYLRPNSPAVDAAGALTLADGAGTASTSLTVDDARFFFDGYGIVAGDSIVIGSGAAVEVTAINYGTKVLTLAAARTWSDDDEIKLDAVNADHIGALPTKRRTIATTTS